MVPTKYILTAYGSIAAPTINIVIDVASDEKAKTKASEIISTLCSIYTKFVLHSYDETNKCYIILCPL